jgi:hypothetical protein
MAVNVNLDVSLDKMLDWKGIREKSGEADTTKACVTNEEIFLGILSGFTSVSVMGVTL